VLNRIMKAIEFGAGFITWSAIYPLLYSEEGRKRVARVVLAIAKEKPEIVEHAKKAFSTVLAENLLENLAKRQAEAAKAAQEADGPSDPFMRTEEPEASGEAVPEPPPVPRTTDRTHDVDPPTRRPIRPRGRGLGDLKARLGLTDATKRSRIHEAIDRIRAGQSVPDAGIPAGDFSADVSSDDDEEVPSFDPITAPRTTVRLPGTARHLGMRKPFIPATGEGSTDGDDSPDSDDDPNGAA